MTRANACVSCAVATGWPRMRPARQARRARRCAGRGACAGLLRPSRLLLCHLVDRLIRLLAELGDLLRVAPLRLAIRGDADDTHGFLDLIAVLDDRFLSLLLQILELVP